MVLNLNIHEFYVQDINILCQALNDPPFTERICHSGTLKWLDLSFSMSCVYIVQKNVAIIITTSEYVKMKDTDAGSCM